MANEKLWKFLRTGLKSENGEHIWKVGEWYKIDGELKICSNGFHASKTPLQALGYVAGEILAQVEVRGESVIEDDKECWSEMRVIKAYNWEKNDSVALAIFAAEQVIDIYEKKYPDDKRPREAIAAARAFLDDPSDKNKAEAALAAARAAEAALAAARAAKAAAWATRAARAAAWTTRAARAAAWATRAAARAARAAEGAARAAWAAERAALAAEAAARAAAWATRAAEGAALRKKLDKWFTSQVKTLKEYE